MNELEQLIEEAKAGVDRLKRIHCEVASANMFQKAALAEQAAGESLLVLDRVVQTMEIAVEKVCQ